jgi:hypothetical protein
LRGNIGIEERIEDESGLKIERLEMQLNELKNEFVGFN